MTIGHVGLNDTSGVTHLHVRLCTFPRQVARILTSGDVHLHVILHTSPCLVDSEMRCGGLQGKVRRLV
ncbi:MAG: hypothetical protein MJY52_02380 [Bacteroidaceae bacterium]|nr:hypothetical protein [Bacteroidaceae bacterium]